ncbi:NADH dehydrogenase [ubiquinone] 1 alpha subcomplex subunit 3 [Alligator mississippiensis]|uniref:NADH dehydrogenase [ubiquinone] 1 alpha subcomplex subunit 3 n=1 Tax=Alligator mississippiensis TaxID=8496 RepID=UPI0003D0FCC1|nr:NADH dehydrogenase [ubiquinone] 1 alpha subcomplex subunit 3 [Alligator mississippiensis]
MAVLDKIVSFLKIAWAKQPVLVVSAGISSVAIVLPFVSPYIKYTEMANRATPYVYPVPVRDDGNMPDIPSHPCDKEGPSLEWLKNM